MNNINKVIEYFYEISKIPRKSGKEEKIADYIEAFAQKSNLEYKRDKYNNIIIVKKATKGKEKQDSIMLQAHLDMVCEKEENSKHNFEKDALDLYIDEDFIKAKGTTLGADNGIGVAIILAILDEKEIEHPKIEAIFTVREETDMLGAKEIDTSMLESNKMICLDNMSEDELWTGCAGAKVYQYNIKGKISKADEGYTLTRIGINGFIGGHSGKDISKPRGNPIKEMGNLLQRLSNKYAIFLKDFCGGNKVNVIPRECYSDIYLKDEEYIKIKQDILSFNSELKERIEEGSQDINVSISRIKSDDTFCFDETSTRRIIRIINEIPNGVYYTDEYDNPLVSLNIGKIEKDSDFTKLYFSIRSNRCKVERELLKNLELIVNKYNVESYLLDELAGYENKEKSEFIEKCKRIYKAHFSKEPKVIDMHIGLEAGFFGQKIPNLDFIAISPDIFDAHSPKERCSISSLKRVYNYLILILEKNYNKILVQVPEQGKAILKYPKCNIEVEVYIGRSGTTEQKQEGDGKTPLGEFELGIILGTQIGIQNKNGLKYKKITEKIYWVDDIYSKYYNQLVNEDEVEKDWNSAEHLIEYPIEYEYLVEIKTNPQNIPGKGSAIFLHCSNNKPTAGCVAVDANIMKMIVENIDKDTRIEIKRG